MSAAHYPSLAYRVGEVVALNPARGVWCIYVSGFPHCAVPVACARNRAAARDTVKTIYTQRRAKG